MYNLIDIKNIEVSFKSENKTAYAIRDVSISIKEREIHAVVGESGCGKSMTALAILDLLPRGGELTKGAILFEGKECNRDKLRGSHISMIFQDPMNSLNPVYRSGNQVAEAVMKNSPKLSKKEVRERVIELFEIVHIPDAEIKVDAYPHELSGGMRQRVMIAMALASKPKLLIADEPTTALDVTIQAQIIALLKELRDKLGMAIMFITHDLGVVANIADRVTVLYAGKVVESATVREVFTTPKHPYTRGLLKALPSLDTDREYLFSIDGQVPEATENINNCLFYNRCICSKEICKEAYPTKVKSSDSHYFYCFNSK